MLSTTFILSLALLLSVSLLSCTSSCLLSLGRVHTEERLKKKNKSHFLRPLARFFFIDQTWDSLFFSLSLAKHLLQVGFIFFATLFFIENIPSEIQPPLSLENHPLLFSLILFAILLISLTSNLIANLIGKIGPKKSISFLSQTSSCILLLCLPITIPFFYIRKIFLHYREKHAHFPSALRMREKIQDLLKETELGAYLDSNQQKFILSVVSFKEKIAREVMVPRIQIFSLASDTSFEEASRKFVDEGYSRIPVYQDSIDNIIGVLLYKDLLKVYIDKKLSNCTIEKLLKPILYTPETKKISQLLQEFRHKQIHLAIVVDEWGGTEGIVTIEDVLEELVGEISDEYDTSSELLYTKLPNGDWIVDAKMSTIDILEDLNISIPQGPEYDTIGGYIFHRAGTIPSKGWKIHHDDFELEVLSSSERSIEKIRITPHLEDRNTP